MIWLILVAMGCTWGETESTELLDRLATLEQENRALQERVTELEVENGDNPRYLADELDAFMTHREVREFVDRRMRGERISRRGLLKADELDAILEDFVDFTDLDEALEETVTDRMLADVLQGYVDRPALAAEVATCVRSKEMPTYLQGYATQAWAQTQFAAAFDRTRTTDKPQFTAK